METINPGDRIKFKVAYPVEAKKRLEWANAQYIYGKGICQQEGRRAVFIKNRQGLVVGYRNAIMDNGEFHCSRSNSEDYIHAKLKGPREKCYLVSYAPWRALVLVRQQDVEKVIKVAYYV
jgi:hypothetical protein